MISPHTAGQRLNYVLAAVPTKAKPDVSAQIVKYVLAIEALVSPDTTFNRMRPLVAYAAASIVAKMRENPKILPPPDNKQSSKEVTRQSVKLTPLYTFITKTVDDELRKGVKAPSRLSRLLEYIKAKFRAVFKRFRINMPLTRFSVMLLQVIALCLKVLLYALTKTASGATSIAAKLTHTDLTTAGNPVAKQIDKLVNKGFKFRPHAMPKHLVTS